MGRLRGDDAPGFPPPRYGDYEVSCEIAAGGFGTVYQATHRESGEVVALKVLHPELVLTRRDVARFEREVRLINLVQHPNVVRVLDLGRTASDQPYFAMELLRGDTVRTRLKTRGRLAPSEALALLGPLCSALDAAHARGIVHRDVKASNVFVTDEGRVVLLDFGIGKLLDDTGPALTESRHVLGTPPSMAPEQILGDEVDPRTDVYALGVLAFHLVTGSLPFAHADLATVQQMHLHDPPPRASARAPVGSPPVSAAIDALLTAALAKDPADRPASAGAFAQALRAALALRPGAASAGHGEPHGEPRGENDIGVHVKFAVAPGAGDDLLDRIEDALARVAEDLARLDLAPVLETATTALLVGTPPAGAAGGIARQRVHHLARTLETELQRELGSHAVQVVISVREGSAASLLRLSNWSA